MVVIHRLIDEARDKGVRYLHCRAMRENRRMLHLLRELDLPEQERREDGVTQFEISLRAEQRRSSVYDKVLPTFQRVKEIAKWHRSLSFCPFYRARRKI